MPKHGISDPFFVLRKNTVLYLSLLILYFCPVLPYPVTVPDDRYMRNGRTGKSEMPRPPGIRMQQNRKSQEESPCLNTEWKLMRFAKRKQK